MDFLDPRKKSRRRRRVIAAYLLMGLLVAGGTAVLIYSSFGYGIDTKTGQIIQNGLVFVGSQPKSAEIYLNGVDSGKSTPAHSLLSSSTRLTLPAGKYVLSLRQTGYRSWQRKFTLDAQDLMRLDYPLLIPAKLTTKNLASYVSKPAFITQSPDQHWVLVAQPGTSGGLSFSQFNASKPSAGPTELNLPAGVATLTSGSWRLIEWSANNNFLLLEHLAGKKNEFIMFDRAAPAKSINLSRLSGVATNQVVLRNGNSNQFYIYQTKGGLLQSFNSDTKSLASVAIGVLAFQPLGQDKLIYITTSGAPAGTVLVKILDKLSNYELTSLKLAGTYLLAAASYQGHDYFSVGTSAALKFNIYKDPLFNLSLTPAKSPKVLATLSLANAQALNVSPASRFIALESGQNISVYDIQTLQAYSFRLSSSLAQPAVWADDYHLAAQTTSNQALLSDYDGSNRQLLVTSSLSAGAYFDPAYDQMFTELVSRSGASLQITSLVVPH